MALDASFVGRSWPPRTYEVAREKIREFADAVGATDPVCHDAEAARSAGHPDVVAPPTFGVVFTWSATREVIDDPALGLDFSGQHLDRVHVTRPGGADRVPQGVAPHFHPLGTGVVLEHRGLLVTGPARTVVDIAGASPFSHGVTAADAALRAGLAREELLTAWDEAGMRRAHRRTGASLPRSNRRAVHPRSASRSDG